MLVITIISILVGGGIYYPRKVVEILKTMPVHANAPETFMELSQREIDVLRAIMMGLSNKEIAGQMFLSVETVKTHIKNIYQKLGARDRAHAAVIGLTRGLVAWT